MVKRFKVTCPLCKESTENDNATQAMLDIPHNENCPGHKKNHGMINAVEYDNSCFEDRLYMSGHH